MIFILQSHPLSSLRLDVWSLVDLFFVTTSWSNVTPSVNFQSPPSAKGTVNCSRSRTVRMSWAWSTRPQDYYRSTYPIVINSATIMPTVYRSNARPSLHPHPNDNQPHQVWCHSHLVSSFICLFVTLLLFLFHFCDENNCFCCFFFVCLFVFKGENKLSNFATERLVAWINEIWKCSLS